MGRLLLVIAVLGTLPSLWGVRVVLAVEDNLLENELLRTDNRICGWGWKSNPDSWSSKLVCPDYSAKCGRTGCEVCCDLGQNCDGANCVCVSASNQNCDLLCKKNSGQRGCCATGVNSKGDCHCCLDNQNCESSKGCTCELDKCSSYCTSQPGPKTTPCCQNGKLCQCCGSNDICTVQGCTPSCKTTCKGDGKGGIPCCKGEECQICDPNTQECSLTNGCQPKEVCESDQACDNWCKGQGVGGGCCSQTKRFNPGLCSCCYRGETCGPSVVPTSPAPKILQNVSLTWEDEDENSMFDLTFDLNADRGWGWGTSAGNGWGRCNCDRSLCEAHCGQWGSKGCCTRLPVKGDLHDFCVCCVKGVNCNQDAKRCECDPNECQKQCKGTCDPSTATCKPNCASNEVCKIGQCQPECDGSCTSANCKSCQNGVCVTSCPPEQCQGGTCTKPCNQTECGATCDGTCDPITNQCNSGCPGTCVSGKCPCDLDKCKLKQPCGICSFGECVTMQCAPGMACNPSTGNCECDKTTCQDSCGQATTACCKNIGTCTCCNQWQTCGPAGHGGFWGLKGDWDCVCDSAKCLASECKQCDPQTQQCVSTCANGQSCVKGQCVSSDSCSGVTCPIPGDSCQNGECKCDAKICGLNNLCEACGSTGHCGPIECGDCATCDPQKGCQFQCDRATQTCVNGVCKCNPATCGQTCNGQCNPQTQQCESGCPGECDGGKCPCKSDQCKSTCQLQGKGDGCCASGSCVCCDQGSYCKDGTTCTPVMKDPCPSEGDCAWTCVGKRFSGGCCPDKVDTSNSHNVGLLQWSLGTVFDLLCESNSLGLFDFLCKPEGGKQCFCCRNDYKCETDQGGCVCDTKTCNPNNCKQCNPGTENCDPIVCGACETCTPGKGCQSTCSADQKCDGTTCVDKCQGVTCPYGDICVGGSCVCDSAVCGAIAGQKCQFCGSSGTCEIKTCPGDTGTQCDPNTGQCVCQKSDCSLKCDGVGAPCCNVDRSECICCPQGQYCAAPGSEAARGAELSGNSSSLERAGVCTDACAGVRCANPGEKCKDGNCECDDTACGRLDQCHACWADKRCGPKDCGECAYCDPETGCGSLWNPATQDCVDGSCKDKCDVVTCPTGKKCVRGVCQCDPAVCGVENKCQFCGPSQTCETKTCPAGLSCDVGSGQCLCTDPTCAAKCSGQGASCCTPDLTECVCCPSGLYCGAGAGGEFGGGGGRESLPTGNSSSVERAGVCTDPCSGLICPSFGDSCQNGECKCNTEVCGVNNSCEACASSGRCEVIVCGDCATCDNQKGCQSACSADQKCDSGACVDKCEGVTCDFAEKCVDGNCVCDPSVCGVGNKCQYCGSTGTCETKTCAAGLSCDAGSGQCLCTDSACAAKCSGQGDPCCTFDMTDCVCCSSDSGFYCGGGDSRGSSARENFQTGNSSSVERLVVGICTDSCLGVTCGNPGDSCQNGDCTCDRSLCGANNLCEACESTGHCGPIDCGPCQTCGEQGCQSSCSADQKCDGTACVDKCQGVTCPYGNSCVGGSCVCDSAVCGVGAGQKCLFCGSSGTCEMRTCPDTGTGCNTATGECICFEYFCSQKCSGVGAPCCKMDRSGCICCPRWTRTRCG